MTDVADQSPSDAIFTRKLSGRRRLSYGSQNSGASSIRTSGPTGTGSVHMKQLRIASSTMSVRSVEYAHGITTRGITAFLTRFIAYRSETEHSEIHSPMPRRHFLLQTESQQWLRLAPLSPSSSRPASPLSAVSTAPPGSALTNSPSRPRREHTLSFSSLLENDSATTARLRSSSISHTYGRAKETKEELESKASAGRRWIRWMHRNRMRNEVLTCSITIAI